MVFVILYYFGSLFMIKDASIKGENVFISMFVVIFAAFGAG
jgi:hypothetical protein